MLNPTMLIAVAGPYSAETQEHRQRNLNVLNQAAAAILKLGHVPVVGVNARNGFRFVCSFFPTFPKIVDYAGKEGIAHVVLQRTSMKPHPANRLS